MIMGSARLRSCTVGCPKLTLVLVLALLAMVVDPAGGRNLPDFSSAASDADKVFAPHFDNQGNPSHGPPLVTLQVSDGTEVDCVPVEQQISAHLPSLQGRPVQIEKASVLPLPQFGEAAECQQLFRQEHGSCPEGTIAVHRHPSHGDYDHGRALTEAATNSFPGGIIFVPQDNDTMSAQFAPEIVQPVAAANVALFWDAFPANEFGGIGATMSVQSQYIEPGYESGVQSSVTYAITYWQRLGGSTPSFAGSGFLSAGFLANPTYFGDNLPRFYTYWMVAVSNEANGACFNMLCPGYVHLSSNIALGSPLTPGTEVSMYIGVDYVNNRYNLYVGSEMVGYWPHSETLFWNFQHFNVDLNLWPTPFVTVGGTVIPFTTNNRVTTTHMGTGKYAAEVGASYMKKVVYGNLTDNLVYWVPTSGLYLSTIYGSVPPRCYDAYIGSDRGNDWGTYLLYGGRGGENPTCLLGS